MPKSPTRQFASRMSGLQIATACLLTIVAPTTLPADEPIPTESTRAEVTVEAAPRRVIPTVATETQSTRPRRRDLSELKALHDDVRGLREDVRRLSELLEKRQAGPMNRELGEEATKHRLPAKAAPQDSRPAELPQKDKSGDGVLTISASEKRPKPIAIQVGQRGEFQFEHRIKTVNGYDGKIIAVTRVAPKQVVVEGQSAGMTSLRLSFDESDEIVDVFVRVMPLADEVTPETKVSLSSNDLLPKPIPLRVGGSAELKFDDWLTRVDGFDPQLIAVTAIDKDRLRVRGLTAGTTSMQLTTRGGKLPIELFVKVRRRTDEEMEQLPVVSTWITAATELAKPIVVSAGGERPVSCDRNVVRISIADQELIDVSQMTPKDFSVVGRKEGCSTVTVWFEGTDAPTELVIKVVPRPDAVGLDNGLLNFTASWCGPCQKMQSLVKKLERAGCPIQTIDVDKSPDVARRFHVETIPCFIRLAEGKEIERVTGLVAEQELRRLAKRTSPILAGLEKRVSLSFEDAALKDVVKKLSELSGVNIVLDKRGLEEEGLTPDAVVSSVVDDITAQSALRLILEPLNLGTVERNEVLLVTSRQRTKGEPMVAVYPVEDLFPLLDPEGKNTPERNDKCLKRIGEVIQSTISPDSWDAVGGQGSLRYYETTRSLVVRQTSDVHDEIARLLEQIRRLKRLPGRASHAVDQPLIVMTYAVADLVVPIPGEPGDQATPGTSDWLKLVDHITTTVEPENWTADGGPCSIETYEKTLSLVIRATPEMHEATADLLNAMRREQDVQVVLETRVLQMADDSVLEQAGLKIEFDPRTRTARLDELGAKRLIEAVHSHHGETLNAPKITLFNGQIAHVQSEERGQDGKLHGFKLYVRGTASKDRRGVRLNVALNPHSLVSELTRQTHKLNDGGYLLLDMTEQFHSSRRYPNPSGGGDLLPDKNGQLHPEQPEKPKGRVLILVQPRILIQEEEVLIGVPAKVDAMNFGGVRPRIIIQDEEEELLGIPVNQKVGGGDASSSPAR